VKRHVVPAIGGHARITPALEGAGVVVELFGPHGGFRAGLGFELDATGAFVRALRQSRKDAEAVAAELFAADEWASQLLERDTEVACRRCGATTRVSFAAALADGFPPCCGRPMRVVSTDAEIDEAVRLHVSTQLFEHDLAEAEVAL
jgi:hypothetical protein